MISVEREKHLVNIFAPVAAPIVFKDFRLTYINPRCAHIDFLLLIGVKFFERFGFVRECADCEGCEEWKKLFNGIPSGGEKINWIGIT